jgi:putative spermidine/putrescine transport system substrate-binding protein
MRNFRQVWQLLRTLGFICLAAWMPPLIAASGTLRVLAWPGYADADLVKVFEQHTGSKVEVTVIDSDDAMWERINKNRAQDFDVFAVNTAELQRYIPEGLVVPINTAAIPNTTRQLPRFRDVSAIAGLVRQGQVYAVPYTYAEMGLIYDRKQVKEAPTSIQALWDPRYQGKVLLYNGSTHIFSLAAQSLGNTNPFKLESGQWPAAVDQLIALRRNAMGFYTEPEESVDLFRSKKAALMLANYGSQQVQLLRAAGMDVGYVIPKEGALAWLDTWAITRGAKNVQLAMDWINYLLEPGPSQALQERQGLANTMSESPNLSAQDRVIWLEPVEDVARRSQLWERIYSGDRASKVLAP